MSVASRLPLDAFYEREARHPRQRFLVQPMGRRPGRDADLGRRWPSGALCRPLAAGSRIATRQPHRADLEKLRPLDHRRPGDLDGRACLGAAGIPI